MTNESHSIQNQSVQHNLDPSAGRESTEQAVTNAFKHECAECLKHLQNGQDKPQDTVQKLDIISKTSPEESIRAAIEQLINDIDSPDIIQKLNTVQSIQKMVENAFNRASHIGINPNKDDQITLDQSSAKENPFAPRVPKMEESDRSEHHNTDNSSSKKKENPRLSTGFMVQIKTLLKRIGL